MTLTMKTPLKDSSMIKSYGYDELMGNLIIVFTNGTSYEFVAVPKQVFDEMEKAESAGKFFVSNIKNKYDFLKLPTAVHI